MSSERIERTFVSASATGWRKRVILRDDQLAWPEMFDLARHAAQQKKSLILLDTGRFSLTELEWIATTGATIMSFGEAGRSWADMVLLKRVARRRGALVIYAHEGPLEMSGEGEKIYYSLRQMGRGGIDLHVSSREQRIEPEALIQLAADCRLGRAWLIYYHHGPVEPWLSSLARERAWIHLSDRFYQNDQFTNLEELLRAFPRSSVRLILHQQEGGMSHLAEIMAAKGGLVVFLIPGGEQVDKYRLGQKRKGKRLPSRAYHLDPKAMF